MDKQGSKKKKIGWFRVSGLGQESVEEDTRDQEGAQEIEIPLSTENDGQADSQNENIFTKENQDKIVLDAIVSLENMIKDRQLILFKSKDLEEQLRHANNTIRRIKQDAIKKDQILQEKNKEIRVLETGLTNKQMRYEQLLEDYNEYQNRSNAEYEMISNQLDAEIDKYDRLKEEARKAQYQSLQEIEDLEEEVRNLGIENKQYEQKYQKIHEEKVELMNTINDFTQRMSFSFTPKTSEDKETSEEKATDQSGE